MYVVAQRVMEPRGGIGINVFLSRHGDRAKDYWSARNLLHIALNDVGERVREYVEVPAGGNRVMSALEAAGSDDVDGAEVATRLDQLRKKVRDTKVLQGGGTVSKDGDVPVALRIFHTPQVLAGRALVAEFDELRARMTRIWNQSAQPHSLPLRIVLQADLSSGAYSYEVDEGSKTRLGKLTSPPSRFAAVTVDIETRNAFEDLYGDIFVELIPTLTGVEYPTIAGLGGIELVDTHGQQRAFWPPR